MPRCALMDSYVLEQIEYQLSDHMQRTQRQIDAWGEQARRRAGR